MWTVYWRGNAQIRERLEDELRSPEQPTVKPKKELPDPDTVLDEVTTFVKLAKDGAYMAGDRRVHHTERSRWRLTFRRLAGDALAALQADDPGPAQQAVAEMVDLACDMKSLGYTVNRSGSGSCISVVRQGRFAAGRSRLGGWPLPCAYDGLPCRRTG